MTTDTTGAQFDVPRYPEGSVRPDPDLDAGDEALLARIAAASEIDAMALAAARDRAWTRLVSEHPVLGARDRATPSRPSSTRLGIVPWSGGIGRRGGWRTVADLGAVAAVLLGLILGSTGIDLLPSGDGAWSLSTQSVAAATPDKAPASVPAEAVRPLPSPTATRAADPVATPLALVLDHTVRHTLDSDR